MNEPMTHDDDQDWLNALAGKAPENMDPVMRAQAAAVRQAAVTRREAIETDAQQHAHGQALARLQARLSSEGLLQTPDEKPATHSWLSKVLGLFGWGAGGGARVISAWSVAAVLVLGVLVAYQVRGPQPDEVDVYRGNPNVTMLIVANPAQRAEELRAQLTALGGEVEVKPVAKARVQVRVKDAPAIRDYLLAQRIDPLPVDGYITLVLAPVKR